MKPFEIPYNFDKQLIDFLTIYNCFPIHCIYCPPYYQDYEGAKYNYLLNTYPKDKQEYYNHIDYIYNSFPNKLMLLLQHNTDILDKKLLKEYMQLGFNKFCVGSIQQAQEIKEVNPSAEIIGSITIKIDNSKIQPNYNQYFDGFVLWFPFNRDITAISKLPQNFKYSLLINCKCSIFCDGAHHWFASAEQEKNYADKCPRLQIPNGNIFENQIFVRPNDLQLFDNYISYWKLQGREYKTERLIHDIVFYTGNYQYYELDKNYNTKMIYNYE